MTDTPIPRDIPLPLPANPVFLEVLLVVAFVLHILFVNLMVGGSLVVLGFQVRGRKEPEYDKLARLLATTITVNKSLAVVLGVAPLLLLNVLYTMHIYTANALTGTAWIMLVPTIATTFLLLYLHKYSWDRLAHHKAVHISILGIAVLLLLFIPLVFLANVNLMMFPERWTTVRGFLGALMLPNVLPRYFHFLCASVILTSLVGVWYVGRPQTKIDETFQRLTRSTIRRDLYGVAFVVSVAQFVVGPIVLVTLPSKGLHTSVLTSITFGVLFAMPAVWMMWQELMGGDTIGQRLPYIAALLTLTVLCMATGRQMYRGVALAEHKRQMRVATEKWVDACAQASYDAQVGAIRASTGVSEGQVLFSTNCAGCHAADRKLVGPSLVEISKLYEEKPEGIVRWAQAPGKRRADSPQMPAFAVVGDTKLRKIADYMLETGKRARP
jgi:cytochrome c